MALFLDTSALAKLYHEELGSAAVQELFGVPDQAPYISRLGAIEMHSVLAGKMRTGEIANDAMELARRRFRSDVRKRRLRVVAMRVRHYELAERLLIVHGATNGLRTLDALQLALALDLHRNGLVDSCVTSDRVLIRVAPLEGVRVLSPEASAR